MKLFFRMLKLLTFILGKPEYNHVVAYNNTDFRPNCGGQNGLTGQRRHTPARIVLMILFSYEVDVLEIALHEAQDLVDKIVIVEASLSHRGVSHVIFTAVN